jgi:hypothetical protein
MRVQACGTECHQRGEVGSESWEKRSQSVGRNHTRNDLSFAPFDAAVSRNVRSFARAGAV